MKTLALVIVLLSVSRAFAAERAATHFDAVAIEAAIRSGAVGSEIEGRARKTDNLHVREITGETVPFQLFSFSDYRAGYTILVESEKRLVILCSAFGGGNAKGFSLDDHDGRAVLLFRYYSGSGRTFEHRARYVIGSGKTEEIGSPRDVTNGK